MNNPKSSFWGSVSYIGRTARSPLLALVAIAGREFFVRNDDPGIKAIRVTAGSNKTLVVTEEIDASGVERICAVYRQADMRLARIIQGELQKVEASLSEETLADWDPHYLKTVVE